MKPVDLNRRSSTMAGEMAAMQDRVVSMAEDLGRLKSELRGKAMALDLGEGEAPMSAGEASRVLEGELDRERFLRIMDYWSTAERIDMMEECYMLTTELVT